MGDDRDHVALLLAGDERAFVAVVQAYHGSLLRLARTFVRSDGVAEEVVQETWLAVVSGLDSLQDPSRFRPWLFRILANRARTRAVRERRSVPLSSLGDDAEFAVEQSRFRGSGAWGDPPRRWEDESAERIVANRQALRCIQEAIDALPEAQRMVITLRELEGLTADEVCNILDVSETNQRVLLHRARARVRAALERHYGQG